MIVNAILAFIGGIIGSALVLFSGWKPWLIVATFAALVLGFGCVLYRMGRSH